jgi:hypothetical protein
VALLAKTRAYLLSKLLFEALEEALVRPNVTPSLERDFVAVASF